MYILYILYMQYIVYIYILCYTYIVYIFIYTHYIYMRTKITIFLISQRTGWLEIPSRHHMLSARKANPAKKLGILSNAWGDQGTHISLWIFGLQKLDKIGVKTTSTILNGRFIRFVWVLSYVMLYTSQNQDEHSMSLTFSGWYWH